MEGCLPTKPTAVQPAAAAAAAAAAVPADIVTPPLTPPTAAAAAREEVYQLRPTGWETDPAEERLPLSLLECILYCVHCNFTLFLRHDHVAAAAADEGDEVLHKRRIAAVFRRGLEKTLSQVRHLVGTIEQDPPSDYVYVKKRESSVKFVVKWLEETQGVPSFEELERASFSARILGDQSLYAIKELPYGEDEPTANPKLSPTVAGFQLNFIRGGAIFTSNIHHWAIDLSGWSYFIHQLAGNCRAIFNANADINPSAPVRFPPWDPASIDQTRWTKRLPASSLVDGPPASTRHPANTAEQQVLLFRIRASKAAQLKQLVQPPPASSSSPSSSPPVAGAEYPPFFSTYDATSAFVWRHLTRARIPFYYPSTSSASSSSPPPPQTNDNNDNKAKQQPSTPPTTTTEWQSLPAPWIGSAVNLRPRFTDPVPPPPTMIRVMVSGSVSERNPQIPMPTLAALAGSPFPTGSPSSPPFSSLPSSFSSSSSSSPSQQQEQHKEEEEEQDKYPLRDIAHYIRRLNQAKTQRQMEDTTLAYAATLRDKTSMRFSLVSKPPMSVFITDHRGANVGGVDFGVGGLRGVVHRFLNGANVAANMVLVYPPAWKEDADADGEDQGTIWSIAVEKDIVPALLAEREWSEFMEFVGYDSFN